MGRRLDGEVALVTGAARGQGRSHAVRLAEEGAHIIALDMCKDSRTAPYPGSTLADLEETAALVEKAGVQVRTHQVDVRDLASIEQALAESVGDLGRLDIVSANAGVISYARLEDVTEEQWQEVVDINLTGVWKTCKAAIPHLRAGGRGGMIAVTSSALGLITFQNTGHYASAKHGLTALVRTLAKELGPERIRVNAIHPGQVDTDLLLNEATFKLFRPDLENPTHDDFAAAASTVTALQIPYVNAIDVSHALAFLASDEARYITGVALTVDGGTAIM
ncbi:mycofactocin-coupled SDR family oxidoreductase [Rhodococcus opacus]|uniref:Mycofactocin-coupled SDR family oxidoreductase n=1 Tax=Rhodococcus opacus TaxID=37919 RepID=A0AAX3YSM0_RHOOP|nr:mycofactocin-coupled SDR family oxidoreductase [Rhodococcus opacus]MCZ4585968.1 mycofactocin-coupled SDR family oxidoreductase [Rhodococcus opacus]WLF52076.1 mycofactocin-coupled SDR family oxidoreductase [Rhodococcus opacus]